VDPARARRVLNNLVALRDAGLREPLPMAVATSQAYAERRHRGDGVDDAVAAARSEWEAHRFTNENAEPEHVLVFGGKLSLAELMSERDESRPDEPTRFGALARRVWTPLLDAEIDVRA
jgi:exodeoxyribonuclease V gamma subunit